VSGAGEERELLSRGELEIQGRLVDASNVTLYCTVALAGVSLECVYKPVAGERPMWDFPDGTLAGREVAAFEVCDALGWGIVPPTVLRDGPVGPGMVQRWVQIDESVDLFELLRRRADEQLRRIALFDALINNGDRKGRHLLPAIGGQIFGIDHGVSFHVQDKLRTVLWQWAGAPLPEDELAVLSELDLPGRGKLAERLAALLSGGELRALRRRLQRLVATGRYPEPSGDWPPVPYPPI
jgi:uncharacterized repeat protein (TIGR03843 family)